MPSRAVAASAALLLAAAVAGCGSSARTATTAPGTTSTTSSPAGAGPSSTSAPLTSSTSSAVTDQPATPSTTAAGPSSPLGATQPVTTADGHALAVRVSMLTHPTPTEVQVHVELTGEGASSTLHPFQDLRLTDAAGAEHGVSLTTQPAGCAALPTSATVSAQAPVSGCVVFTVAAGTTAATITFIADGAPASSAVRWSAA